MHPGGVPHYIPPGCSAPSFAAVVAVVAVVAAVAAVAVVAAYGFES